MPQESCVLQHWHCQASGVSRNRRRSKNLGRLGDRKLQVSKMSKKTSVGKTANMWVFGQKNVIFSNSSFNSSDMPQTLSTAVTRHQRPWATWDDQWRSGEKLRKIQEFQGSLPTNCHHFKGTYLHKFAGMTYSALLGQFPYIYLYYICKPHRDHWHKESQVTTFLPLTQSKRCCGHEHGISLGKDIINGSDLFPFLGSNVQFF